ncbi:hypothetical protein [Bifidobacterium catenulatum]|uniref:Uncharacterized protein n=1 Tax=Bifidobacterium catenulatum PV20-2 TaxID=1447716 RepID=A0A0A7I615_9BIFI|nr:hypothetical protein [Bifidobacterium catenulatum]AIZ15441.1 hypothetical protein AH68_05075 [Bifidobacterium catenulatum PV20-2]
MTVKIVKLRSLITLPCAYSNTVDDGYFRYAMVDGKRVGDVVKLKPDWGGGYVFNEEWHDGKRGVQIGAHTLADLKKKIADHYQN